MNECCHSVQGTMASLVGAQAEVAKPGQDHAAVTVSTLEWSILLLSEWALLPHCPLILLIYMLGCAFFILLIAHTRVLVLRTAVFFLTWLSSHM